jgi:hypothetical protein
MDEPILTNDHIRTKARRAFEAGESHKDCPYNWHSPAHKIWREEFHRLEVEAQLQRSAQRMAERAVA